jgi:hypothetical protein
MRNAILILCSLFLLTGNAAAQQVERHRGLGYVVVGPGSDNLFNISVTTLQVGGGGERIVYKGLGLGADLTLILSRDDFEAGPLSFNGSYHFASESSASKADPFVSGGYSLAVFSGATENWFNLGGGVNYWFRERVGLRADFRDFVDPNHDELFHLWAFRVGLSLR